MPVLVEANSVIVRVAAIHEKLQGGMEAFRHLVPNKTLCCDNELARVGFMTPEDVRTFEGRLCEHGLEYLKDGKAIDFVFANQVEGLTAYSTWAEFGRINLDGDPAKPIGACRLTGSQQAKVFTPEGWKFEGSLSHHSGYVPNDQTHGRPVYIGQKDGLDVYFDPKMGKQVFIGRPFSKD